MLLRVSRQVIRSQRVGVKFSLVHNSSRPDLNVKLILRQSFDLYKQNQLRESTNHLERALELLKNSEEYQHLLPLQIHASSCYYEQGRLEVLFYPKPL
eukprot:TRINITY_DN16139_c0_g1_i1.p1 TRINITY_DN16139_c0_g1~~TRINITY_DN16139_c0_g1_i1.p1  ORF type:complete len:114 (+),score=20.88 TRINITY_DN16139_c0_g1_i1:51-344(+)